MRIRLVKYVTYFLLSSTLASMIRSFIKAARSTRDFFLIVFRVFVKVFILMLVDFILLCLYGISEDGY